MIPVRCSTVSGDSVASVAQEEPPRDPGAMNQPTPNYMGEKWRLAPHAEAVGRPKAVSKAGRKRPHQASYGEETKRLYHGSLGGSLSCAITLRDSRTPRIEPVGLGSSVCHSDIATP